MASRHLALLFVTIGASLAFSATSPSAAESSPRENVIEFSTRPKSKNGLVVCALFAEAGWLTKPVKPAWAKIGTRGALCRFEGVRPGVYGISAYHDENANGKLDTNVLGMPTEDYGASRDARGTFGPPRFEDAKFDYRGGTLKLSAKLE
ncbi:MAG: DUF2141 domain-containing protein [Polyangiaceae bacterium]